jgi:hypothetical protein
VAEDLVDVVMVLLALGGVADDAVAVAQRDARLDVLGIALEHLLERRDRLLVVTAQELVEALHVLAERLAPLQLLGGPLDATKEQQRDHEQDDGEQPLRDDGLLAEQLPEVRPGRGEHVSILRLRRAGVGACGSTRGQSGRHSRSTRRTVHSALRLPS